MHILFCTHSEARQLQDLGLLLRGEEPTPELEVTSSSYSIATSSSQEQRGPAEIEVERGSTVEQFRPE
eukprot:5066742-Alexandrium_andersonii.AAC.1